MNMSKTSFTSLCTVMLLSVVVALGYAIPVQGGSEGDMNISRSTPHQDNNTTANAMLNVSVLIDFRDTTYYWSHVEMTNNSSAFNATQKACEELGFELDHSESEMGVFVNGINGVMNAADWSESWLWYVWNDTKMEWETALVGADQYTPSSGESIAWSYDNWGDSPPVPSPEKPDPELVENDVLIDFGNATYKWEDVILEKGSDVLDAYYQAAEELGLTLNVTNTSFGDYISGVGGVEAEGARFWAVLEFENGSWKYADAGAGELPLKVKGAWALYYTVWGYPLPIATPENQHPSQSSFAPRLSAPSFEYLGNGTFGVDLGINTSYNLPREVTLWLNNNTFSFVKDESNPFLWRAEVGELGNFTYYLNTSLGAASDSKAALKGSPGTIDLREVRSGSGEWKREQRGEAKVGNTSAVYRTAKGEGRVNVTVMEDVPDDEGRGIGLFFDYTLEDDDLLWINITVSYADIDLPDSLDENDLRMYRWNESSGEAGEWQRCERTGVDIANEEVWANVTHLTIFAPLAEQGRDSGKDWSGYNTLLVLIVSALLLLVLLYTFLWDRIRRKR